MEDIQHPVTPSDDSEERSYNLDAMEVRFTDFCKKGLALDEKKCTEAIKLFKGTKQILSANVLGIGSGKPNEAERFWFAFVMFTVKRLSVAKEENQQSVYGDCGFSLDQILKVAKLNIVDFFKELPQFVVKAGPVLTDIYGADWENRLQAKELQANFVHLSLLSKYYKLAYREVFMTGDANVEKDSDIATYTGFKKEDKGIDLLSSLCNSYDTAEDELRKTVEQANNLIETILKKKPRPASERQNENLENIDPDGLLYFEGLLDGASLPASLNMLEKDYDDATQNKSELDERIFINEEDSLHGSGSLSGGGVNITGVKRNLDSPARTVTCPLSPHRSPSVARTTGVGAANNKITATKVSTAMTTAKWLRTIISTLPLKPSPDLERFLKACDRDITNDVTRRAHVILEAIFPKSSLGERRASGSLQSANLTDEIWAEQRRSETLRFYYRVLEAMCKAEAQVLHANNLTPLLTNERFHRCMLACSAELVLATHKNITMLLPAVLERTGLTAFDLSKVIESFVRHEDSFPKELRRHLNTLEEWLLESMVWEKGSSMYNSLIIARPSLSSEINRLALLAEPMPSLDAIAALINFSSGGSSPLSSVQKHESSPGKVGDMRSPKRLCSDYRSVLVEHNFFTSPVKDRLLTFSNIKSKMPPPPLQSAFASPTRPNPGGGGQTCAETGINVFFTKINKLAAVRINGMVERLQLAQQIRESVYCLFQQILGQRTSLFFNRNIDQIILCCFYGVAKISQLNLTFKEIIYNYRKQPHCKPLVFRSVFVDSSQGRRGGRVGPHHVDIITFYNEVFIPLVKPLLMELGPAGTTTKNNQIADINNKPEGRCPESPKVSAFPSLPDMSPKKVSTSHNVYVSPLRTSKMDALISHSSKSYYACVGESTHAYQSPSKDLTAINNRLNSNRKVREALNFDRVDAGLVSDSMVANSLYLQTGSAAPSSATPLKTKQPDL